MKVKDHIKIFRLIVLSIPFLFKCSGDIYAQTPKYYFDIVDVSNTSYSFNEGGKDFRFRALTVQPEEYNFIVIELIQLGKGELEKSRLRDSFYIRDSDFDVIVISDVQFLEWVSAKRLKVKINNEKCYVINLMNYEQGVEVELCP